MNNSNKHYTRRDVIIKIKEILRKATSTVVLIVPKIEDLEELQLYDIKSSIIIRIACAANFLGFHSELLDEIESLDNITLRDYKEQDRYVINRDNEELFMAIIGEREDNLLTIYTTDKQHIRILGFSSADSWLKGRKF